MQRYTINSSQLNEIAKKRGYESLSQFAMAHHINRSTLQHYLEGKGPLMEPFYQICNALSMDPLHLLSPMTPVAFGEEIMPIIQSLSRGDPKLAMVLLGSRAKGTTKKFSDWDIGLTRGKIGLPSEEFIKLKNQAEELADHLVRSMDLVNLDGAPKWFLSGMDYTPVFLAGNNENWNYFLGVLHGIQKYAA